MKAIICLIFSVFGFTVQAQHPGVSISISNLSWQDGQVHVTLYFENQADTGLLFYKPNIEDACFGLFIIEMRLKGSTAKPEHIYLCDNIIDLDHIQINSVNSFFLNKNESFSKKYVLEASHFFPKLKREKYELRIKLAYSSVNFESKYREVFAEDIQSNFFNVNGE